jgi:hypothetical protein
MKLSELQIDILRSVRDRLAEEQDSTDAYICFKIDKETWSRAVKESNLLRNRMFFWRASSISIKWVERARVLRKAINGALRGSSTVSVWFDSQTRELCIKLNEDDLENNRLYKQMRLAWLERSIETGEIR